MAGEWQSVTFCELCDICRGGSPRPIQEWLAPVGIPWVKISDASDAHSRFIESTGEFIRPEGSGKSREVVPGDLILSNSATPGIPMFMSIHACIHDGWLLLRSFRGLDKLFCFYLLKFERENIVRQGNGSVFTNLKTEILKNHAVRLPPVPEQKRIADILGSLDEKIELNRRTNRVLEDMARAIFKAWFVDFEPVKAKADGATGFPGMPQEVFDQLPDRFTDSELGPVPEGWEVVAVGAIAEQVIGGQWGVEPPKPGLTPAICLRGCDMEDLRKHGASRRAPTRYIKPKALAKRILDQNDLLVASSGAGPCGRPLWCAPHLQTMHAAPVIYSNFVKRFSTPSDAHAIFLDRLLFEMFKDGSIRDYITGTSVPNLDSKGLLEGCMLALPSEPMLQAFADKCQPIYDRLYLRENTVLAELRDTLLPKLISGELRVPQADEIVKERIG